MNPLPHLRELSVERPPPAIPDHELLRCIGRGSYGEVWLARTALGSFRAIKVVFRSDFEDARPYEREYTGIRKYEPVSRSHPGLVDVLQVGRNESQGYFYYVMELADAVQPDSGENGKPAAPRSVGQRARSTAPGAGGDSDSTAMRPSPSAVPAGRAVVPDTYSPHTLSAERRRRGRLPAPESIELGASLSDALAALHRAGLIHRDIKPSNIIFVEGVPKLADIGLVTDAMESGSYVGTEGFIPPEGPNNPQADVYRLGKVLYEAAMGKDRLDFPEPPSELEDLPDRHLLIELNAVLLRACQPDRQSRHASAAALRDELLLLQCGKSVRERRRREQQTRWLKFVAAGLIGITALSLGVERVLDWRARALQGQSRALQPNLVGRVAPRDSRLPSELIDLTPFYTAPLNSPWYPGPEENTLSGLPRGRQTFGGTDFDVRGLVQLNGTEIAGYGADAYPSRVSGIYLDRRLQKLHFLHGTISEVSHGVRIGSYRIIYRSGRRVEVPLVFGHNVGPIWQVAATPGLLPGAELAWQGQNPATQARGLELRLYTVTWENPRPAEPILEVEFSSAHRNSAPFLVAMTADAAPETPGPQRQPIRLKETLQQTADSFREQALLQTGEAFSWSTVTVNAVAVEIGGRFYDGLRFTTPTEPARDLVWSFRTQGSFIAEWFILPRQGALKVGFEDFYHFREGADVGANSRIHAMVQHLSGRKLEPGQEYCIVFVGDARDPIRLDVALRFVPAGTVDPNQPASLAAALGLAPQPAGDYHRHYCLGIDH